MPAEEKIDLISQQILDAVAAVQHNLAAKIGVGGLQELPRLLQRHLRVGIVLEIEAHQSVGVGLGVRDELVDLGDDRLARVERIGTPKKSGISRELAARYVQWIGVTGALRAFMDDAEDAGCFQRGKVVDRIAVKNVDDIGRHRAAFLTTIFCPFELKQVAFVHLKLSCLTRRLSAATRQ